MAQSSPDQGAGAVSTSDTFQVLGPRPGVRLAFCPLPSAPSLLPQDLSASPHWVGDGLARLPELLYL